MKKLGFGLMRLPQLDKDDYGSVDIERVKKMVDASVKESRGQPINGALKQAIIG
ncbi:MAG: hypothetical protein HDR09_13240 [Lachnospiraceae bacterium]|nr:hypothetical protein [Lachnospiraceae bacterium]